MKCMGFDFDTDVELDKLYGWQTNEEWIRSCTEFELIELLADLVDSGILKRWAIKYHCADDERRAVELWLKEKHEDA